MRQPTAESLQQASSRLPFSPATLWVGAGALILYGLARRSKSGLAIAGAGGALALKAATSPKPTPRARATFLVNAPAQKAYDLWRQFENLPRFMAHLESVKVVDERRSEWTARGPLDHEFRWQAEITEDQPGKRIGWRSLPNSDIQTSGWVEFRANPQNRGTYVAAEVNYWSPAGAMGRALAFLVGRHPQFMVREDLRRFKALLETGETPTIQGQTHGPRGAHGRIEQTLFREETNHPQPQAA